MNARPTAARVVGVAVLVAVAATVVVLIAGSHSSRTLRAAFTEANNVIVGQQVRIAGRRVGHVSAVDNAGDEAVLTMAIDDTRNWPLRRGTTARLRFGTTTSVAGRYVQLQPGPRSAPALPDGGVLSTSDTITPVEFDQLFNVVDGSARRDLRGLVDNAAAGVRGQGENLQSGLRAAPGGFAAVAALLRELGADPAALQSLVSSGHRTVAALAAHDGSLESAIADGATTFAALGDRSTALTQTLDALPITLRTARGTFARTDRSVVTLRALVTELRPGVAALPHTAASADRLLKVLDQVAPLATTTLARGTRAAPAISALLGAGVPFVDRVQGVLSAAQPLLACIRPYSPDLAALVSTWSGFAKNYDSYDHYIRLHPLVRLYNDTIPLSSKDVAGIPGFQYAFPRPPGLAVDQPWLQPQCAAGSESTDPAKDPEGRR
jgi:virulence factor Mce-like protein